MGYKQLNSMCMKWGEKNKRTHQHSQGGRTQSFQAVAGLQRKALPRQTHSSSGLCHLPSAERWSHSERGCSGLHSHWCGFCLQHCSPWTRSGCTWTALQGDAASYASGTHRRVKGFFAQPHREEPQIPPHASPRTECHCVLDQNKKKRNVFECIQL